MNKAEFKAKYGALRAIYLAAIRMDSHEKDSNGRAIAIEAAWQLIDDFGFTEIFLGRHRNTTYDIKTNQWAIRHNSRF